MNRYVINNTIYDVNAGVNSPASAGSLQIVNNIISGITESQGSHVFVEMERTASASAMHHNLLQGAGPDQVGRGDGLRPFTVSASGEC